MNLDGECGISRHQRSNVEITTTTYLCISCSGEWRVGWLVVRQSWPWHPSCLVPCPHCGKELHPHSLKVHITSQQQRATVHDTGSVIDGTNFHSGVCVDQRANIFLVRRNKCRAGFCCHVQHCPNGNPPVSHASRKWTLQSEVDSMVLSANTPSLCPSCPMMCHSSSWGLKALTFWWMTCVCWDQAGGRTASAIKWQLQQQECQWLCSWGVKVTLKHRHL